MFWITYLPPMRRNHPPIGDAWLSSVTDGTVCHQEYGGSMSIERQYEIVHRGRQRHGGFTLVELMVTVAVIAILAVVATPSMSAMLNNSRVTAQAEEMVSSLQLARSEAVRRNARVTVCAGANGVCNNSANWNQWTVFGRDNTATPPVDDVIRDTQISGSVQMSGPADSIVFRPSGMIDAEQALGIVMADQNRCVTVQISGVVTVSREACS